MLELSKWLVLKDLKAKNCSNSCPKCEEPKDFLFESSVPLRWEHDQKIKSETGIEIFQPNVS